MKYIFDAHLSLHQKTREFPVRQSAPPVRFMGRHPLFGKIKRTRNVAGGIRDTERGVKWENSPYYLWWKALTLSSAYRDVCRHRGKTTNKRMEEIYSDFGDVSAQDFPKWWRDNGERLFGEPRSPSRVFLVTPQDIASYQPSVDSGQTLLIGIPLFLTKRDIASATRKLVAKYHPGKRGRSSMSARQQQSRAHYKLRHYKSIHALKLALAVLELRQNGKKLREVATILNLREEIQVISRRERMGKTIVAGVERGAFPVTR